MVLHQTKIHCTLCSSVIFKNLIVEEENSFCCHGCHAVWQILKAKNHLDQFEKHPIYIQAVKSGLITNPDLLEQIESKFCKATDSTEKFHLEIGNMWCPSCAEVIHLILLREKGVISCFIDYTTDFGIIDFSKLLISKERIIKIIESIGYRPILLEDSENKPLSQALNLKFIVAAFCSLNIMMFSYPLYASYFDYDPLEYGKLFAILSFFMSIPIVTYCFWPILKKFYSAILFGIYGMETLVVFGVASSFMLSIFELITDGTKVYFDSMAVIITFMLLGKILESKAKFIAKNSLLRLHASVPRRVRKYFEDGRMEFVPIKEIKKNDLFAVFQGEKVAIDGIVESGTGYLDESLMTGESLPVFKEKNLKVVGGSILQNGRLTIRAESTDQESALKRIIDLVEIGLKSKPKSRQMVDTIVAWFVPFVLCVATLTAVYFFLQGDSEKAFINALSVILISCPCAIGIAAPLAESYLMNALGTNHAIVRNRAALPFLGKESVFVFDKTGTITTGDFRIIKGFEKLTAQECALLKSMTSQSQHLISLSIAKCIKEIGFALDKLEEIPGRGLRAVFGSDIYHLGSFEFLKLEGLSCEGMEEDETSNDDNIVSSKVYFAHNYKLKTIFYLGDTIREGVKELIASLKPVKTILLSGDAEKTVFLVSDAVKFDAYHAGFSPLRKKEFVTSLKSQGHIVCMVGDGINDAPALTEAQIGISVVTATDISIQVSDILLTTDDLRILLKIKDLGSFGHTILKQNLFWAFFYNVVGVFLAVFGLLSPIFATFAMMISSLIVLYNAKRITNKI